MELKVIAYARNGHTDKFGIPRQSREESPILTRIVFEAEYNVAEALRGIEGFSYLWVLWGFSDVQRNKVQCTKEVQKEWSPTVRPPRLGGNKRMGVFATRSPFRPNPIGLTSVRLIGVRKGELIVSGADMMDGTPIYDIKPYLSFSDSHPEAKNGFAEQSANHTLQIIHDETQIPGDTPEDILRDIDYILSQDPRPAYHDDGRDYKMDYGGWRVTFNVQKNEDTPAKNIIRLQKIEKI